MIRCLLPATRHLLLVFAFFGILSAGKSQTGNTYTYHIKINAVTDLVTYKDASGVLKPIFDVLPRFDDGSDVITIVSDYLVSQESLSLKLAEYGYTLTGYQLVRHDKNPK